MSNLLFTNMQSIDIIMLTVLLGKAKTPHTCVIVQRRGVAYHHTDKSQLLECFSYLFTNEKGTIIPASLFPKEKWTIPLYTE